jgi:predicted ATP-dependent serine protease
MSNSSEPIKLEKEKRKSAFRRALTPAEILAKRYSTIKWSEKWKDAFSNPESTGIISICGNSGNGKSSFTMQMIKELSECLGRGHMNAYEENAKLTMQNLLINNHMQSVNGKITIIKETFDATYQRLCSSKSARFVVLDSVQAMRLTYKQYELLKDYQQAYFLLEKFFQPLFH